MGQFKKGRNQVLALIRKQVEFDLYTEMLPLAFTLLKYKL